MHLINNLKESIWHDLPESNSYEWWRFDAIDDKGEYSFVTIFFSGNPFNASKKPNQSRTSSVCLVSFSLYNKGRLMYSQFYETPRNKITVEKKMGIDTIYVDKSNFYYDDIKKKYYLNINLSLSDWDNRFKAEFEYDIKSGADLLKDQTGKFRDHYWLPSGMSCEVTGKFKFYKDFKRRKTDFSGKGYCDHVWGIESFSNSIDSWSWGRFISDNVSVVFICIRHADGNDYSKMMVSRNGNIEESDTFELKSGSSIFSGAGKLEINTSRYKILIRNVKKLENENGNVARYETDYDFEENGSAAIKNVRGMFESIKLKKSKPEKSSFLSSFKKSK